jgi:hypothetical protein
MRSQEEQEALETALDEALNEHRTAQLNYNALLDAIDLADSALGKLKDAPSIPQDLIQTASKTLDILRTAGFGLHHRVENAANWANAAWEASN